jgi:hypothetical protein
MDRANRAIIWGSTTTVALVATCIAFAFLTINPAHGKHAGAIVLIGWYFAAYALTLAGFFVVGIGTFFNLAERRGNPQLETPGNVWRYRLGAGFSIVVFALLVAPWLL